MRNRISRNSGRGKKKGVGGGQNKVGRRKRTGKPSGIRKATSTERGDTWGPSELKPEESAGGVKKKRCLTLHRGEKVD